MPITDNIKRPPPKWYRKFENAYIAVIAPAIMLSIQGWGLSNLLNVRLMIVVTLSTAVAKGIGMMISNGEVYAPADTKTEEVNLVKTTTVIDTTNDKIQKS